MIWQQIRALASHLGKYIDEFAGCFLTPVTFLHLRQYVQGQLSDLPRKSVEPIAHLVDVPPRTLQEFLSLSEWDHDGLRDTVQRIVARDHGEEQAIGIIDESGHPKKGDQTACVSRQYCGASGKVDNCVMGVHLCFASFDGKFRAMLDSDLFLPEKGWDKDRRKKAGIPESLVYRPKHMIALEQLERAAVNGLHLGWVTADIWYGEKPAFIEGLEDLGLRFVLEIPRNLMGWVREPTGADDKRGEVQDMARWSRPMVRQEWTDFHIKDTGMGPMVWETRACPFWMKRDGEVVGPYWLIATRDRLNQDKIKYFLSNAQPGIPLEVLLHVAFSRWPVERCLEDEKSELGLSHFEVRKYNGVLRHLRITQVSHLFLARQTIRLAEKKSGGDDLPGEGRGQRADRRVAAKPGGPQPACGQGRPDHPRDAAEERRGKKVTRQGETQTLAKAWRAAENDPVLHPGTRRVAL
jgi:SRSO17 transposase